MILQTASLKGSQSIDQTIMISDRFRIDLIICLIMTVKAGFE